MRAAQAGTIAPSRELVDSERILTELRTSGYTVAPDYAGADLVVVNTCGFIDEARAESLQAIAEGCNHRCSFCIIPSLRGPLVSRPIGEVLAEAERLVAAGVQELLVIAQDTSAYGAVLRYRTGFWGGRPLKTRIHELAAALGTLGAWVRLHYVYPYAHVGGLVELMAEERILPYLDVPLQHGSPAVLRRMRRPAATEDTLARIQSWRRICPHLTVRSTFVVGFPGETEAQFEELLQFLEAAELDGVVHLHGAAGLAGGDRVRAVVERADAYDLHARVVAS